MSYIYLSLYKSHQIVVMDNFHQRQIQGNKNLARGVFYDLDTLGKYIFLTQKAEKLTSALYKITDFINDAEPLKWELRKAGLDFLGVMISSDSINGEIASYKANFIDKITALLNVSFIGSYVSKMNFSILKDEYVSLKTMILETQRSSLASDDLSISKEEIYLLTTGQKAQYIGHNIKDIHKGHTNKTSKGHIEIKVPQSLRGFGNRAKDSQSVAERDKRKSLIIDFIKVSGDVSIKDILKNASFARGLSSKTIQRELTAMVLSGTLEKNGERRWSRYFIKK